MLTGSAWMRLQESMPCILVVEREYNIHRETLEVMPVYR